VDTALWRGNDWAFAETVDGVGTSSFPAWFGIDDTSFALRVGFSRSAARACDPPGRLWLSELQGGRGSHGLDVLPSVRADQQQRWVWTGFGEGAEAILFRCWRDEVFGQEAAGFGLSGGDGFAGERLLSMRKTGKVLAEHAWLLDDFAPQEPQVGVYFSPQTYYLLWCKQARTRPPSEDLSGYCRALVRAGIPFCLVEEDHLAVLDHLKVLFLPRALVMADNVARRLERFVADGGTIFCESECGAYDSRGVWRYPRDRWLSGLCGGEEAGRRALGGDFVPVVFDGVKLRLPVERWLTPMTGSRAEVLAEHEDGALMSRQRVGNGMVYLFGSFLGGPYLDGSERGQGPHRAFIFDFEDLLHRVVCSAGVAPACELLEPPRPRGYHVQVHTGTARGRNIAVVVSEEDRLVVARFPEGYFGGRPRDILSGKDPSIRDTAGAQVLRIRTGEWGVAVIVEAE
jgi:beta-galactosidase